MSGTRTRLRRVSEREDGERVAVEEEEKRSADGRGLKGKEQKK